MSLKRTGELYTGAKIPLLGFGTYQADGKQMYDAAREALATGYRHLDCAYIYRNEDQVGKAIAESGVKREDLFVTSKLWNTFHEPQRVAPALKKSLEDLQLDYLDLYLIHWPYAQAFDGDEVDVFENDTNEQIKEKKSPPADAATTLLDTWRAMEELVESGKVKHIGVSNCTIAHLKTILAGGTIRPAVNQVEMHPYLPQHELVAFCKENNIHVTGYAPLGSFGEPSVLDEPKLKHIAETNRTDAAHVALAWGQQRGCTVIPKSRDPGHIASNFQDFAISLAEMQEIDSISTRNRFFQSFPVFED